MTTITIDRAVLEQALEALETYPVTVNHWKIVMRPSADALRAALAQEQAEPVQEPYTDDVTRIMREAGMTFHLGLPHKAVVEQMTRVVDLVYAEASIKAAQQFAAAPPQREPLTDEEISNLWSWSMTVEAERTATTQQHAFARAIERAHGIGEGASC